MITKTIILEHSKLTNSELESLLKAQVAKETELLIQILHLLAEVERRRLYSHQYPSLFEYCVKELKYSCGSAQRRIDTMRAMKLMPEIEQKLQTGELQMIVVSQAQSFFRQEKKSGKTYDIKAKREIFSILENKSARECEKELVSISPQSVSPDRRREIDGSRTELRITMDQELVKKLDRLKSLLSNKYPHLTDQELISKLADFAIKKLDPALQSKKDISKIDKAETTREANGAGANAKFSKSSVKKEADPPPQAATPNDKVSTGTSLPALEVRTKRVNRYIPVKLKSEVWARDEGRCTFPGCNSRHRLQLDHIQPLAKGGKTTLTNLRLLCQTHNLLAARLEFGDCKISRYLRV